MLRRREMQAQLFPSLQALCFGQPIVPSSGLARTVPALCAASTRCGGGCVRRNAPNAARHRLASNNQFHNATVQLRAGQASG